MPGQNNVWQKNRVQHGATLQEDIYSRGQLCAVYDSNRAEDKSREVRNENYIGRAQGAASE